MQASPLSSALQRAFTSGTSTITAEVMPPRGGDPARTLAMASGLRGWVHAVNVTDGSRAVMRMCSLAVCRLLLDIGIEPVLQLACRDRNRIALQADLLGAHALGIRNLLCLTGDPVQAGDQLKARAVHDYESVRLLEQVSAFNRGEDPVNNCLAEGSTALFAGAAADPNNRNLSSLHRRLERKRNAGARFLQTQMVMDPAILEHFQTKLAGPLELPVLAGVFLLKSARNARFINQMVPGACVPESLITRLENSSHPSYEGITIAAEQVRRYRDICAGVHVMAVRAEDKIPEILDRAGVSPVLL
ncbi:methylenetetrahydrofolate reductase [cyanobiont of Ornithocercus magnificus]|nr:methylenetetrahydrofolate reductase [cyanobiont of Ornithocercus magnificus]